MNSSVPALGPGLENPFPHHTHEHTHTPTHTRIPLLGQGRWESYSAEHPITSAIRLFYHRIKEQKWSQLQIALPWLQLCVHWSASGKTQLFLPNACHLLTINNDLWYYWLVPKWSLGPQGAPQSRETLGGQFWLVPLHTQGEGEGRHLPQPDPHKTEGNISWLDPVASVSIETPLNNRTYLSENISEARFKNTAAGPALFP